MKNYKQLFISCCCLLITTSSVLGIYEGSQVWKVTPSNQQELEFINKFIELNSAHIDMWQQSSVIHRSVDFMVPVDKLETFRAQLQPHITKFEVMIRDVHAIVSQQNDDMQRRRQSRGQLKDLGDFDYEVYHTPEEIQEWMDLVTDAFPEVEQFQIGVTYEGRKINVLKVSTDPSANKTVIYVDSLIHAREWITAASVMWAFKEVLTNPDYAYMKNEFDWYIIPMINADGYAYTHSDDRLWRKTRSKGVNLQSGTTCQGVDANRNWDFKWGGDGASPFPCDTTYHGPMGFSESETRHLSYFIEQNKDHIIAAISVHSYSQLLLYPYNYAEGAYPPNKDEHDTLGEAMKDAMFAIDGKEYTFGQGAETIYVCTGVTTDWTAGVADIDINFTFELRDTGEYGFLLPEDQIVPTAQEFLAALKVLVDHLISS